MLVEPQATVCFDRPEPYTQENTRVQQPAFANQALLCTETATAAEYEELHFIFVFDRRTVEFDEVRRSRRFKLSFPTSGVLGSLYGLL